MTRPRRTYEYPDGAVLSVDGRLRFSVATQEGPRRFLARPRVRRWRLVEVDVAGSYRDESGEVAVWTRSEDAGHPWPWCLYVHVDGTTAVLHADDTLRVYDPDGRYVGAADVFAGLGGDPRTRHYTARTTAGPLWDIFPKGCFAAPGGRLCVVLRTFWGARVLVDARTAALVVETPAMSGALRAAEEAWALARLLRAVRAGGEVPFYTLFAAQGARDVVAAAQLAGQLGLAGAAPLLAGLRHEEPGIVGETHREDGPYRASAGEPDIRHYTTSLSRRAIQLALLRLGREPAADPAYYFFADTRDGRRHDPGPRPATWAQALSDVRPGLSPGALLARAGAPFHVDADTWEYDLLAGGARTIRVTWGRLGVRDTRVVAPPEWVSGHARDRLR